MRHHLTRRTSLACLILALGVAQAFAAVPTVMNYQGRLTDNSPQQNPLNASVAIEFQLYGSSGGTDLLWSETWAAVPVSNGVFSVLLGSNGSPLPPTVFQEATRYLELAVNGETLVPRQRFGTVGYAFEAGRLAIVCGQGQTLQRAGDDWVCADVSVCPPGGTVSCYTGPAATINVGTCRAGSAECNTAGSAYGACTGDVVPVAEICPNQLDDDCNGIPDDTCSCPSGELNCGGTCIDPNVDSDNCQTCGLACPIGQTCQGGSCTAGPIYAGMVTDDADPTQPGGGVVSVWEFGGKIGTAAGDLMCAQIGGDHACTYQELVVAESVGELQALTQLSLTFWVHRVATTVQVGGQNSPPGAGGRCNDWTYPTGHIADGEYARVLNGRIDYFFDQNTAYTGNTADGNAGTGPNDGGECGGPTRAILCCN